MIPADPYERVKLSRGKSKERQPLTEDELDKLRTIKLSKPMDHVRDLFIYSAYTGLVYCDVQVFNFEQMTEKIGKIYYIDGERLKTGTKFFTPILNPAMQVLKKYDYNLPKITNQKGNEYLHLIQHAMGLRKSLTFHVARHSFATLAISHGVPIEDVVRMLGHEDIRTTQIFGIFRFDKFVQRRARLYQRSLFKGPFLCFLSLSFDSDLGIIISCINVQRQIIYCKPENYTIPGVIV